MPKDPHIHSLPLPGKRIGRKGGGEGDILCEVRFYFKNVLDIKKLLNTNTNTQKCYIQNF